MINASGSGDGVGSQPKVPDESVESNKLHDEGTGVNQGSYDKSNDDADNNSDNKDGDSKDDDCNSNVGDSERVDSDSHKDVDPNLNLKEDEEEETHDEEYVRTPDYYVPTNEESREENRESNEEEMKDASLEDVSQEKKYEQVVEDAHLTPTSTEKTEGSKQTSSVSFNFESKVNHSAQLLATIKQQNPAIIDDILSTRIGYATQIALQSYTVEFKKECLEEKHRNLMLS
ncbi:hypothetical protein Tco_0572490 [Tanacetum coccineum]